MGLLADVKMKFSSGKVQYCIDLGSVKMSFVKPCGALMIRRSGCLTSNAPKPWPLLQQEHRSRSRHQTIVNLRGHQPPSQEKAVQDSKPRPGAGSLAGWSRFAAYQPVSKVKARSLIIVKRGGGKKMPNTLVDPSGDRPTSAALATSYKRREVQVPWLATL